MFGVPRINLKQEVKQLFAKNGAVSRIRVITDELSASGAGMCFAAISAQMTELNFFG